MKKNGYFSIKKTLPSWFSLHHHRIPLKSYLFMCHLNIQHWSLCLCDSHWIAKRNKDVHHLGFIFSFVWHFFLISLKNKFGMWQWDGGWACDIVIISGPVPTWPNSFSSWKTHTHTHEAKGKLSHPLLLSGSMRTLESWTEPLVYYFSCIKVASVAWIQSRHILFCPS